MVDVESTFHDLVLLLIFKNVGVFKCQPLTMNQIVKKTTRHKHIWNQNEIKVNLVQNFSKGFIQNVKGIFHN